MTGSGKHDRIGKCDRVRETRQNQGNTTVSGKCDRIRETQQDQVNMTGTGKQQQLDHRNSTDKSTETELQTQPEYKRN